MYAERKALYQKIEAFTGSKVLCYVTGDRRNAELQIGMDIMDWVVEHLDKIGVTPKISLILYSRGGDLLAGWSLVNLVRQFCDEFDVIIPLKAYSTATLISLGANQIWMTKQATLGPIDPSVNGPLNPQRPGNDPSQRVPVSVESLNGYIEYAKKLGVKGPAGIQQVLLDLASKVHPLVLGNVFRSRLQIRMLGKRLLQKHFRDSAKIDKILDFLCSESGSHDYSIYRREARDELHLQVKKPSQEQYKIIKDLHDDYVKELMLGTVFDPNITLGTSPTAQYDLTRGLIESVDGGSTRFKTTGTLTRITAQTPPGVPPVEHIKDQRTHEGWHHENP